MVRLGRALATAGLLLVLSGWAQQAHAQDLQEAEAAVASSERSRPAVCSVSGEEVRVELRRFLDYYQEVRVAVAVQAGDTLVISRAEGMADMEWKTPLSVDGRFQVASVAKAFTAAALLRLAEQGSLDLDAPIQQYLPDFPAPDNGRVTLRLLAGHLGGIRHYRDNEKTGRFLSKHFASAREGIQRIGPDP